jgi:hypothetical protein
MAQRPVTLADIVSGHVSLEIEGFDRLYFNGWVPALQTSGQIARWLHWRGFPMTRTTPGVFSTRLLNRGDQVTVNLSFKHSRVKIYLNEDRALRVETVINDPDLGCKRSLEHLDELAAKARACNARLIDAVIAGQGSGILANPVIERIAHPTTDAAGRRVPAMRFADPRVQALAGCLAPGTTPSPASPTRAFAPGRPDCAAPPTP